ncbi:MAG TPA: hypothetical protein VGK90_12550 [Rhizomicrobium sp.]
MLAKLFLATSALVLCVSNSLAGQQPADPGKSAPLVLPGGHDRNAQFLAWYGPRALHNGSTVLYEQSASAGLAKYAIPSWENDSAYRLAVSDTLAADDFTIPGKGIHKITAVYVKGVIKPVDDLAWVNVEFFDKVKYDKKTGATTAVVKAQCPGMRFTDTTGTGDLMVDVTGCNTGTFRGGHDYAVSVQPQSADLVWYWQTNRKRVGRPGFWYNYEGGGNGPCTTLTPIRICFPTKGYGPDLAFAIYGN